jgi:hypothetical protein
VTTKDGTFLTNRSSRTVGGGEVEVHPLLEPAELLGRQLGGPLVRLARAVLDLGFREQVPQVDVVDVRLELLRGVGRGQEVLEVAADQRLVVADRRQSGDGVEVRGEVGGGLVRLGPLEQGLGHVRLAARQAQVFQEQGAVGGDLRAVEGEAVVQDVGLQRVVRRGQPADEGQQPVEVGPGGGRVAPPVLVGPRVELGDPGVDERRVVEQVGPRAEQVLQLGERQLPVDGERAELRRVLRAQVGGDEARQVVDVRPGEPLQEQPAAFPVEGLGGEPVEGRILERVEAAVAGEGAELQCLPCDEFLVQRRRQVRGGAGPHALVVEADAEPVAEVVQRPLRVAGVGQQGVPGLDLGEPRRLAEALQPRSCQGLGLVELLGVEWCRQW